MTIAGSGFTVDTVIKVDTVECPILSQTSTEIVCVAPPLLTAGNRNVYAYEPSFDPVSYAGGARYKDTSTPTISATNVSGTSTSVFDLSNYISSFTKTTYYTKT